MSPQATLDIGQFVSHYRVLEYVGRGGMSVIYKAEDRVLGRTVALKFLSEELSRDATVIDRFRREARTASALNHPNICTIHEIGEDGGQPFIAMEFLEGQTLREMIRGRPMDTVRLIDYGLQIASGLEAAHEKGIIHRDLKPANIFITNAGYAKILDFGLAKLTPVHSLVAAQTTDSEHLSASGAVMGTVAYMSPEQALGRDLDARTDLFSLGVVLYEMATGILPFRGDTSAAVFDAILHSAPAPPVRLNPGVPAELERIINTCLEKDRNTRYQSATEICADLKRLKRESSSTHEVAVSMPSGRRRPWTYAAGAAAVVLCAVLWLVWRAQPRAPVVTSIDPITRDGLYKSTPLSDGTRVYFAEELQERLTLAQVSAAGGDVVRIPTPFTNAILWDIAPDHTALLVSEHPQTNPTMSFWMLPLPGGTPRRVGDLEGREAEWTPDGDRLIVVRGSDISLANQDGSETRKLLSTPGIPLQVRFSPDRRRLRYTLLSQQNTLALWEAKADGSDAHPLLADWRGQPRECCGRWSPDGRWYVFMDKGRGDIWAMAEPGWWNAGRRRAPVQLTSGPLFFYDLSFSPDGRRLFAAGALPRGQLVRYDPGSHAFVPYLSGISAGELAFSRDGQWITYVSYPDESLWRCRSDGSERLQLTQSIAATLPRWSPDGTRIAFVSAIWGRPWKVYVIPAAGGTPQELLPENANEVDADWSPNGKQVVFGRMSSRADTEPLEILAVDVATKKVSVVPGSAGRFSPRWSPDGRYLAALSGDSRSISVFDFQRQTWSEWTKVTEGSIGYPAWSSDGRSLYYGAFLSEHPSEWRIRVGGHTPEMVADFNGEHRFGESWGSWSGLTPDGGVLIVRDASTEEIYSIRVKGL